MTDRPDRLARVARAFEARSKMLETGIARLTREIRDADTAIFEIGEAMESPLVLAVSLHVPAARRIADLKQKSIAMDAQLAALRSELIATKTRAQLAEDLAGSLMSAGLRKESEREALETATIMSASSLRQGGSV